MKKFFILSAAAIVCIALSACNGGEEAVTAVSDVTALTGETTASESVTQEDAEADTENDTETEASTEESSETESTADTDGGDDLDSNAEEIVAEEDIDDDVPENDVPAAGGTLAFDSFEDIDPLTLSGAGEPIAVRDSRTYELFKKLETADKLYIDAETADGSSMAAFAASDGKLYAYSFDGNAAREGLAIIRDDRIYVISPAEEMGIYLPYDETTAAVYNIKTVLGMNGTDFENADGEIYVGKVAAEGAEYEFECGAESGVLYGKNGEPQALIFPSYSAESASSTVWTVNKLSFDNVPKDIFDIPEGYNITSLEDMTVPEAE